MQTDSTDSQIHVAITRTIRAGKELEYEAALLEFFQKSLEFEGSGGAQLLRPPPHSDRREYGILRTFRDAKARDDFYNSDLFREWEQTIAPLQEKAATSNELHGLEAFFRENQCSSPSRWKMALITWLAVIVSILFWSNLLPMLPWTGPDWVRIPRDAALTVATLTWVLMPLPTKLFKPWLISCPNLD